MDLIIERQDLLNAGEIVNVVKSGSDMPILGYTLIEVSEEATFKRTSLDFGVVHSIKAEVHEPGVILVPSRFWETVKSATESKLRITYAAQEVTIIDGSSQTRLETMDPGDFPSVPEPTGGQTVTVARDWLVSILGLLLSSLGKDDQGLLAGVLFEISASHVSFVTCNGHCLTKVDAPDSSGEEPMNVVLPKSILTAAKRITPKELVFLVAEKEVFVTDSEQTSYFARSLDGQYPDYQKVCLPMSHKAQINKDTLARRVAQGLPLRYSDKVTVFRFQGGEGIVHLDVHTVFGCYRSSMPINGSIVNPISLSIDYLRAALKHIPGSWVEFHSSESAVSILSPELGIYHLMMGRRNEEGERNE